MHRVNFSILLSSISNSATRYTPPVIPIGNTFITITLPAVGRIAIIQIITVMAVSLLLACLFSDEENIVFVIVRFACSVQIISIFLQLLLSFFTFQDNFYFSVAFFHIKLFQIGNLYCEKIIIEKKLNGIHFASKIFKLLGGCVVITRILCRENAIKAGWIDAHDDGAIEDDADMMSTTRIDSTHRNTIAFSMGTIYSTSKDDEGGSSVFTSNEGANNSTDSVVVDNPIYLSATKFQSSSNKMGDTLRLQQSAINNSSTDATAIDDDDQALYEEYQSIQSQHDDEAYDMATTSFEEWKIKKQFKQGNSYSLFVIICTYPIVRNHCRYTWFICQSISSV